MGNPSRRDFLKLATTALLGASGLLGLAGFFEFLDFQAQPSPKTEFDLGPVSAYPIGSRTVLAQTPAILIHASGGFTALSLVCTHLGCTTEQTPDGFACPCHGSRYDQNGTVLRGPAQKPLRALRVEISSDERLILHTD